MRLVLDTLLVSAIAIPVFFPEIRGLLPASVWLGGLALLVLLRPSVAGCECEGLWEAARRRQHRRREGRCTNTRPATTAIGW